MNEKKIKSNKYNGAEVFNKDDEVISIRKNKYYDKATPLISVGTSVYNRINVIDRTLDSVKNQDYKNFEYIIVDDGSTDGVEKKIYKYMDEVDFPVIYIKKNNGGVHTARNRAYKIARGKYFTGIDSDDVLLPNALSTFLNAWESIPSDKVNEYREVVALYANQNHEIVGGGGFPDDINTKDKKTAQKICDSLKGDHSCMNITKILKENLLPEPKGVKFIWENILWRKLDKVYRAYYINEVTGIYYQEGDDHLSRITKKNIQTVINMLYNSWAYLNDRKTYIYSFKEKIKMILKYQISKRIIKRSNTKIYFDYKIKDKNIRFYIILLYIPTLFATHIYLNKYKELKKCIIK